MYIQIEKSSWLNPTNGFGEIRPELVPIRRTPPDCASLLPVLPEEPLLHATPTIAKTIAAAMIVRGRRSLPAIHRLPEEPRSIRMPSPPQLGCPARIRAGRVLSHNNGRQARNPGTRRFRQARTHLRIIRRRIAGRHPARCWRAERAPRSTPTRL